MGDDDRKEDNDKIERITFVIDEAPFVFYGGRLSLINKLFLDGIDPSYWQYQALTHSEHFGEATDEHIQQAACALRVAFGQGIETLFALAGALVQAPSFPVGWVSKYRNVQLRSVVEKIQSVRPILTTIRRHPISWGTLSQLVHQGVQHPDEQRLAHQFAALWSRFAADFLAPHFEDEYNAMKHGMRAKAGGFAMAIGVEKPPGQRPSDDAMRWFATTDFGSTFHVPVKMPSAKWSFEFQTASRAWSPSHYIVGLQLIAHSIQNITTRFRILAGERENLTFSWPTDDEVYELPWRDHPSIQHMTLWEKVKLDGIGEPSEAEILAVYRT